MLREIRQARQTAGEEPRRWFRDDRIDLIVWYAVPKGITGFQLCYRLDGEEKALTWLAGRGFSHDRVDDGEGRPDDYNMTPMLVGDGAFDTEKVLQMFEAACLEMDSVIVDFVVGKLRQL